MARIVWLVQLDADVKQLQEDMSEVQADIKDLRAGQHEILILLWELAHDARDLRSDSSASPQFSWLGSDTP